MSALYVEVPNLNLASYFWVSHFLQANNETEPDKDNIMPNPFMHIFPQNLIHILIINPVVPKIIFTWQCYLLQPSFHLGPEAGSSTKTPPSHSTQLEMPVLFRPCGHVGWVHELHPLPFFISLKNQFLQLTQFWIHSTFLQQSCLIQGQGWGRSK
jgi:hypothetical protein